MSNVLRRNRATSEVEFIHNATRIRREVTSMVMNEKVFPKRYRFVYSIPMINLCRELVKSANTYYNCVGEDDDEAFLYKRKKEALMNMYDRCEDILAEMQDARERLHIKMSVREQVVGLIVDEENLINDLLKHEEESHINFMKHNSRK